ncbi:hypothetical protein ACIBUY_02665 [Streptomyces sp. NPDC050085]|uniref:hypothetical protein n=1 Tax=Streptomyces sp. NPDC050085 TaxID=3365600 RepID=UPI00378A39FD
MRAVSHSAYASRPCSRSRVRRTGTPLRRRAMMAEAPDALVRLLRGETVTEKTGWYELAEARLQLGPYRPEGLQLAVASTVSPSGAVQAGRHGIGLLSLAAADPGGLAGLTANWAAYEKTCAGHGHTPDRAKWRLVVPMHLAETREQAEYGVRHMVRYLEGLSGTLLPWGRTAAGAVERWTTEGFPIFGIATIGTPADAIARIEALAACSCSTCPRRPRPRSCTRTTCSPGTSPRTAPVRPGAGPPRWSGRTRTATGWSGRCTPRWRRPYARAAPDGRPGRRDDAGRRPAPRPVPGRRDPRPRAGPRPGARRAPRHRHPRLRPVRGHELCARVLSPGEWEGRVVVGLPWALDSGGTLRTVGCATAFPGGFGERVVLQEAALVPVPEHLPPHVATLTAPLAVGYGNVARAAPEPGSGALVIGAGPIGPGASPPSSSRSPPRAAGQRLMVLECSGRSPETVRRRTRPHIKRWARTKRFGPTAHTFRRATATALPAPRGGCP